MRCFWVRNTRFGPRLAVAACLLAGAAGCGEAGRKELMHSICVEAGYCAKKCPDGTDASPVTESCTPPEREKSKL